MSLGGIKKNGGVSSTIKDIPLCARLHDLREWTEYGMGVRAWADHRLSLAATPVTATTRNDCKDPSIFYIFSFSS